MQKSDGASAGNLGLFAPPRRFLGYGIFVLIMEIAGATTTLLYGINMIWHPMNAPVPEDPANPGLPKARRPPARCPLPVLRRAHVLHALPAQSQLGS